MLRLKPLLSCPPRVENMIYQQTYAMVYMNEAINIADEV